MAPTVATPSTAPASDSSRAFRAGDFTLGFSVGPAILVHPVSETAFGLGIDLLYNISDNAAFGANLTPTFGSGVITFSVAPTFLYRFSLGDGAHTPFVRVALPIEIIKPSRGKTGIALGLLQLGGGYRYWVNRTFGVGAEVAFLPGLLVSPGQEFFFAVSLLFGVELRF